jgi:hypothetical protein
MPSRPGPAILNATPERISLKYKIKVLVILAMNDLKRLKPMPENALL